MFQPHARTRAPGPLNPAQWSSLHNVNLSHDFFFPSDSCAPSLALALSPGKSTCVRVLACWFASRESPRKGQLASLLLPSFPLSFIDMVNADHLRADPWLQLSSCIFTSAYCSNIILIYYRPYKGAVYHCYHTSTERKALYYAPLLI